MYEYVPSRLGDDFGLSDRMEYSSCRFYQHLTILDDSYNVRCRRDFQALFTQ